MYSVPLQSLARTSRSFVSTPAIPPGADPDLEVNVLGNAIIIQYGGDYSSLL